MRSLPKSKNKPADDDSIVELYLSRDERAIDETDLKYRSYLLTVAFNIIKNREDCLECLNDTYLGAWNSIPPEKPKVLKAYLTVIMRRVAINRYHSNMRKCQIPTEMTMSLDELDGVLAHSENVESAVSTKAIAKVINDFIRSLTARQQYIFISRYYMYCPVKKIANDLSISRSTIQKELAAIKAELKEKLESEGL